jgi:hypothetical protein
MRFAFNSRSLESTSNNAIDGAMVQANDGTLALASFQQLGSQEPWMTPSQLMPEFATSSSVPTVSPFNAVGAQTFGALVDRQEDTPMTQHDLFYQCSTPSVDMTSNDFSFLHRRPASSCSSSIRQYIHSRTSSLVDVNEATTEMERTPTKASTTRSSLTPTTKTDPRRPLSQQRRRKVTSRGTSSGLSASGRASSVSSVTPVKIASMFANTKRLPLRLPRPPLCLISDPHADLCLHLRRHGMDVEADEFATAEGITVQFALRGWIQTSLGGAIGLLNQTNVFLDKHASIVKTQLESAKTDHDQAVPSHFDIPVAELDEHADDNCLTPTHILAVHGTGSSLEDPDEAKGLLIPCHALMYALQCVSLPAFPTSMARHEGETQRTLPVVSLRVPRPSYYPTLHRFLYHRDASALLVELLPMKHIARHWDQVKSKEQLQQQEQHLSYASYLATSSTTSPPTSATDVLSHLPTQSLFGFAYKIHSAWANGVAIGLLEGTYWSTLDRAWNLIMAALSIKKARILDMEMKGMRLHPGRDNE